ncbi:PIN domain-containing protein [Conchiformibius steedae]|uniref:PIN domain-containing protein n=1 Tax=Conchiformibius steedae TaxID=153493 RepID=UPI0015F610E6|nr:PIN domain-containing protein [Conchiformibius steedae]QMT34102.1 hypothetical protein H3L98_03620 [Conchiformibius steedae]
MRHIMIDNENVHLKNIPDLGSEPCCLWLFTGFLQDKIPTELTQSLLALQKDNVHTVQLIDVAQTGDNALDFCLTYQMGRISKEYGAENVCFCVFSKDKGFDAVINHMLANKHCAYAVRVSDGSFLSLTEAELRSRVSPPVPAPYKPQKSFHPNRLYGQTRHQGRAFVRETPYLPPPEYKALPPYLITVNMGAAKAWEGLKNHPEARARSRSHLAYRLKEFVLKDWLTYPEPRRSKLVEDIIDRLLEQGSLIRDGQSELLDYDFVFMQQADEWIGKLYEWIQRRSPKPPQTRDALFNWFRVQSGLHERMPQAVLDKLVQMCVWRGLISIGDDARVAYRLLSPKHKTAKPAAAAPSHELNAQDSAVYAATAAVQESDLFRHAAAEGISRELWFEECAKQIAAQPFWADKSAVEREAAAGRVWACLQENQLIAADQNGLFAPVDETRARYDAVVGQICRSIIAKASTRPRSTDKLLKSCLVFRNKYAPLEVGHVLYILHLCQHRGYLVLQAGQDVVYPNVPLPMEEVLPETGQVETGQVETGQVETGQVETGQVETGQVETGQVETGQVETGQVETGQVETGQVETGQVETGQVETGQVETGQVETGQVETGQVETGQVETGQVETGQVETGQVETGQVETEQVETEQVETEQVETEQVETEQVETPNGKHVGAADVEKLLAGVRRFIAGRTAEQLPDSDTGLMDLLKSAGLPPHYAEQAVYELVRHGDVAIHAEAGGYRLTYTVQS